MEIRCTRCWHLYSILCTKCGLSWISWRMSISKCQPGKAISRQALQLGNVTFVANNKVWRQWHWYILKTSIPFNTSLRLLYSHRRTLGWRTEKASQCRRAGPYPVSFLPLQGSLLLLPCTLYFLVSNGIFYFVFNWCVLFNKWIETVKTHTKKIFALKKLLMMLRQI